MVLTFYTVEGEKETSCGQFHGSVNRYSGIINPLSEFTENFLQEKIMFYRQKNRRLADLRMIDDQIKSDCKNSCFLPYICIYASP